MRTAPENSGAEKSGTSKAPRRIWTMHEEQSLLIALKDIVKRGWKCENGFKTGYLNTLENLMAQSCPGTNLRAEPHIQSKIHVWKKNYGSLCTMLSRSGFGWSDATSTFDVPDDVWFEYVKTDANAKSMRYKSWPFYNDWQEIFGKDRATGENAEAFADALNDLVMNASPTDDNGAETSRPINLNTNTDASSEFVGLTRAETSSSSKGKGKKRSRDDDLERNMMAMMADFFTKTDSNMRDLVTRIGFEHDAQSDRRKVFDALEQFDYLTDEDKFNVTKFICNDTNTLDIFFSVGVVRKETMINMILQGRY